MITSFQDLIFPLSAEAFFQEKIGREPFHLRGARGRFSYLLDWSTLDRILARSRLSSPRLRFLKDKRIVPSEEYSHRKIDGHNGEWDVLEIDKVAKQLSEGATILCESIDEVHDPINELCRVLEWDLTRPFRAHAFASTCNVQGFPTHWDFEDLFVTQVSGEKHWRVLTPTRKNPLRSELKTQKDPPSEVYWEGDLRSGDVLYIPHGWWHDGVSTGGDSIHLAIAYDPLTGHDFARWVVANLAEVEDIRAHLPLYGAAEDKERYVRLFREAVEPFLTTAWLDAYLDGVRGRTSPRTHLSLPWIAAKNQHPIPLSAWLQWIPPHRGQLGRTDDAVVLETMGAKFSFVEAALPVLTDLMEVRKIRLESLCARHPSADVATFVPHLVSSGLVAVSCSEQRGAAL